MRRKHLGRHLPASPAPFMPPDSLRSVRVSVCWFSLCLVPALAVCTVTRDREERGPGKARPGWGNLGLDGLSSWRSSMSCSWSQHSTHRPEFSQASLAGPIPRVGHRVHRLGSLVSWVPVSCCL